MMVVMVVVMGGGGGRGSVACIRNSTEALYPVEYINAWGW